MTYQTKRTLSWTAAVVLLCSPLTLPHAAAATALSQTAPDNSGTNKAQNQTGTADNQIDPKADRQTTANIRKAIIADKDLSTYAHNIKILVKSGRVTLKGPVKSDDEKQKVATDAATIVAAGAITNDLTVKQ